MTDDDYARKLDEVNRLLNDPNVPIQPALIWSLLAEVSAHESQARIIRKH
jgi:antitoxin component HigA of HigAB toxin-antitoxin module